VDLVSLFQASFRELRPRSLLPEFAIEFHPFANVNNTIRLRRGRVLVRLSDLLEGAPRSVLRAIAHILLAKLYRKPIEPAHAMRYRVHLSTRHMRAKAHQLRELRGQKRIYSAQGKVYDLEALFDALNLRFFGGLLARPRITWSRAKARNLLGHYDPAHNVIVISRVFDSERVPLYVIEYIVFHEMLHLLHPVTAHGGRRCVHPPAFQHEEKRFQELEQAKAFLKQLGSVQSP
jgi:hypothetical protein